MKTFSRVNIINSKHLPSTYYIPGTILDARKIVMIVTDKIHTLMEIFIIGGRWEYILVEGWGINR